MADENSRTALIYAYKTKNAEQFGLDPEEIHLAYQVDQPFFKHQCDWGKDSTKQMLKNFKEEGGYIKVINSKKELILPLPEHNVIIPVPQNLLKEWELTDLLD